MAPVASKIIGITTASLIFGFALACGNTHAGASDGNTETVTQPQVTKAAYISAGSGNQLLVAGDVPSGQLSYVHIMFLNSADAAVNVDTNDDGVADDSGMDVPAIHDTTGHEFFLSVELKSSLCANVGRIGVQAVDQDGDVSNTVYADLDVRPLLAVGDVCDPRGFDVCPQDSSCSIPRDSWQAHCTIAPAN